LFLEKATRSLLAMSSRFGMIIPNPWLTNLTQNKIRQLLTAALSIEQVVHFHYPVFRKVTVDTQIIILSKPWVSNNRITAFFAYQKDDLIEGTFEESGHQIAHKQKDWQSLNGDVINIFLSDSERKLALKIQSETRLLSDHLNINVGIKPYQTGKGIPPQSKALVDERPFDSDRALTPDYRQYLRGKDISRYAIRPIEPRYIRYGVWLAEPRPAANFSAPAKIFMRQTGDSLVGALDTGQLLCLNNMHVLVPQPTSAPLEYLLGIINSRLMNWFYQTRNPEAGEALAEIKKANVAALPIKDPNSNTETIVQIVHRMLQLQRQLTQARTSPQRTALERQIGATDREIDQLVYELYGLSDKEIALVEEATAEK
jgi:adenine-specific DNA-methyltransferase